MVKKKKKCKIYSEERDNQTCDKNVRKKSEITEQS